MFSIDRGVIDLTVLALSFFLFPSFLVILYVGVRYLSLSVHAHIDASPLNLFLGGFFLSFLLSYRIALCMRQKIRFSMW